MRRAKRNKSMVVAIVFIVVAVGAVAGLLLRKGPREDHGVGGGNSSGESKEVREAREKWKQDWLALRSEIAFDVWKQGKNPKLAESAAAHLKEMTANQISTESAEQLVIQWFKNEVNTAKREVERIKADPSSYFENKDKVIRAQNWCDQMGVVAGGYEFLKTPSDGLQEIRDLATPITGFKGTFALRVIVGPYAEIADLKAGDKTVAIDEKLSRFTPFFLDAVEVADCKLVLKHPEHGTHEVPLTGLVPGKVYHVTGTWTDKANIKVIAQ